MEVSWAMKILICMNKQLKDTKEKVGMQAFPLEGNHQCNPMGLCAGICAAQQSPK